MFFFFRDRCSPKHKHAHKHALSKPIKEKGFLKIPKRVLTTKLFDLEIQEWKNLRCAYATKISLEGC